MADDTEGWTLHAAPIEEGWTLHPAADAPAAQSQAPTLPQALGRGAVQGATLGFGDEINGVVQAAGDELTGRSPGVSFPDLYRRNRDVFRRENAAAQAEHPWAYGGTELAASLPAMALPGLNVAKGTGVLGTMGRTALAGGLGGLGASEAKTAWGDAGNALVGAGVGGVLGGVGARVGKFAGKAADEVRLAYADAAQGVSKMAEKAARSARGSLGGTVASILDAAKSYEHALTSALATPEQKLAAQAALDNPEFQKLYQHALGNKLELVPEAMDGQLVTARNVHEAAQAARAPEAIEAGAAQSMAHPWRDQILPRLKTYAERAVPVALGAHYGGIPGAAVGTAMAAVMGKPGTAFANMVKNPGVRNVLWSGLGGVADHAVQPALTRSGAAAGLEMSPEIAARLAALRKGKEPDESAWTLEPAP